MDTSLKAIAKAQQTRELSEELARGYVEAKARLKRTIAVKGLDTQTVLRRTITHAYELEGRSLDEGTLEMMVLQLAMVFE